MNGLIKRLQKIQDECIDKNKGKGQVEEGEVDEFTRLKRKVAAEVKEIRQKIKERDELESTAPGNKHTVEMSLEIRKLMKDTRTDATQLNELQKKQEEKYKKKNKQDPEKEAQIESRQEIVDLAFKHLKECEKLDKRRLGGDNVFIADGEKSNDPVITELPDIDDEGFKMLKKNDQVIDGMLDNISQGVNVLKEMATEMGKGVELQGMIVDSLDARVDKVNDQLENLNERMRKTLESIRKGDKIILDIILLCVLLGIGGYIYHMVSG